MSGATAGAGERENASACLATLETVYAAARCDYDDRDDPYDCIGSDVGELEWPDDYCLRCYTLWMVRSAVAAVREAEARAERAERALRYIAGYDVGGFDAHLDAASVACEALAAVSGEAPTDEA